jgi:hypothetical protein
MSNFGHLIIMTAQSTSQKCSILIRIRGTNLRATKPQEETASSDRQKRSSKSGAIWRKLVYFTNYVTSVYTLITLYIWLTNTSSHLTRCELQQAETIDRNQCLLSITLVPPLHSRSPERKRSLCFWVLFICLSRACLGKMLVFMYKWLKRTRFRSPPTPQQRPSSAAPPA